MFSINDYILVSHDGQLFKTSIANLQAVYLPINENDKVEELTEAIYEVSAYILELSSTIMEEYTPIEQLNSKYETRLSTDAISSDETILEDETIENMIADSKILTKEDAEDAYESIVDKCENEFERAQNKLDSNWFD